MDKKKKSEYNRKYYNKSKEVYTRLMSGHCNVCGKEYANIKQHCNTKIHKKRKEEQTNTIMEKVINNAEMMSKVLELLNAPES